MAGHTIYGTLLETVVAGTIVGENNTYQQGGLTVQAQIIAGVVTYEFGFAPEQNIAVQIVPAMKVDHAVVSSEFGDINSRWRL